MKIELSSIDGWQDGMKCVPTALCAISGMPAEHITMVLQMAGAKGPLGLFDSYDINDWMEAVKLLGGVPTRIVDNSGLGYSERPTIDEFMTSERPAGVHLVFGENELKTDTHVFAVDGTDVVDTYSGGERIAFEGASDEYNAFRVKYVFKISEDRPPAVDVESP